MPAGVILSLTEPQFYLCPWTLAVEASKFSHILKGFVPRSVGREMKRLGMVGVGAGDCSVPQAPF